MKTTRPLLALLPFLSIALALPSAAAPASHFYNSFTLVVSRPNSPIDQLPLTATHGGFMIGEPTQTFCPSIVGCAGYTNDTLSLVCPNASTLAGPCSMAADVPGGQAVYIDAGYGFVLYTAPHAGVAPKNGRQGVFTYEEDGRGGHLWSVQRSVANGLVACARGDGCDLTTGDKCAPWQVMAEVEGLDITGCLQFDALAKPTDAVAWEYV